MQTDLTAEASSINDEIVAGHPDAAFPMRLADFGSLAEALDYAALAKTGMNFYNTRGEIEHSLSYAGIRERALDIAKKLMGRGIARGERVGIVADMHPDFVACFFACQYAGLLAVPLPVVTGLGGAQGYEKQLKTILETSNASIALGAAEIVASLERAAEGTNVEIVTTIADLVQGPETDVPLKPLGDHEVSHIQFSSGSTRYPLGIEISQSAVMANAKSISSDALSFTHKDRVASWLPFYHDMGLIGCMIVPITCQMTIDYLYTDSFARRPAQWLRIISKNKCTVSFSPTFGYDVCARRMKGKQDEDLDLSNWRIAGIGGDMIQSDVMADFVDTFGAYGFKAGAFVPSYGLAEMTLAFSFQDLDVGVTVDYVDKKLLSEEGIAKSQDIKNDMFDSSAVRAIASCGKPMPGYNVEILNNNNDALPDRSVGGVFISGPSMMSGYHKNQVETDACLSKDQWLDTGDMGYMADGILYITGRRKDMILLNGRNIWPQDMEGHAEHNVEMLRSRDTAAFAVQDADGNENAVILVQCRSPKEDIRAQLKQEVHAEVLRSTGVDAKVELIPQRSLPFTTSGKLRRLEAKKLWKRGAFKK